MRSDVKPTMSVNQHISLLRERGMEVDGALARQWLQNVSYYRLSGYAHFFRASDPENGDGLADNFISGTTFQDVAALYEFDRKLRTHLHDGIERLEVGLRTRLIDLLAQDGPLAYKDSSLFRPTFNHTQWMKIARRRTQRAKKHSLAIRHNAEKYGDFPIWVLMDVLDFSDASKLYEGLHLSQQTQIADSLGVHIDGTLLNRRQRRVLSHGHPLARWFEQLTVIRNAEAHHSRVWNQIFIPASTSALRTDDRFSSLPVGQSERVYGGLLLIARLLEVISPGSRWAGNTKLLIEEQFDPIQFRNTTEMGFPEGWRNMPVWNNPAGL